MAWAQEGRARVGMVFRISPVPQPPGLASWFNSFKNERVHGIRYMTRAEMTAESFEYVEVFYNRKRLHSTLGYKSPTRFLNDWINTQYDEKLVA